MRALDQAGQRPVARVGIDDRVGGRLQPGPRHLRPRSSSRGRRWGLLAALVLSAVFSLIYNHAAVSHPTTLWTADRGDPDAIIWFISWVQFAVFHGHTGLLSNYALLPGGVNLMANTSVYLPAVVVSPVTWAGGPILAFNVLDLAAPVVTAGSAYLLFSRHLATPLAGVVAAVTFAFCPFLLYQQLGHQQLTLIGLLPLLVLLVEEVAVHQRHRWWVLGGLLGVVAAAQLLTGEEALVLCALLCVTVLLVLALRRPGEVRPRIGYALRAGVLALVVFVVLLAYPLYLQYDGPRRVQEVHPAAQFSLDPVTLIQPLRQWINPGLVAHWTALLTASEPIGYLGIPLLLAAALAVGLTVRRRPAVLVAAVVLLVFIGLSFGPQLKVDGHVVLHWWPWAALEHVGQLAQVLPVRLSLVTDLAAAFLLGVLVDVLATRVRRAPGRVAGAVLVVLALLSWVPAAAATSAPVVPSFFTTSAEDVVPQGSVALILPYMADETVGQARLWQAEGGMRFRTPEGWLIVPGPHQGPPTLLSQTFTAVETGPVTLTPALAVQLEAGLRAADISEVIVGPGPGEARSIALLTALFSRPADVRTGGVQLWWTSSADRH